MSDWYKKRFNVDLAHDQVVALLGSKEGLANIARAFINPGDHVLVLTQLTQFTLTAAQSSATAQPVPMPLLEENSFQPDFEAVDAKKAKMMFINYPNNPTAATVDKKFLKEAVEFAKDNNIILCYDNAYSEITYDGYRAPSILEIDGAMDVAIEFHSLSKTFNMTGDRIGFAVGNKQLIAGLTKVKSQIDSGPPVYTQKVAVKALGAIQAVKHQSSSRKTTKFYKNAATSLLKLSAKSATNATSPKQPSTFGLTARATRWSSLRNCSMLVWLLLRELALANMAKVMCV